MTALETQNAARAAAPLARSWKPSASPWWRPAAVLGRYEWATTVADFEQVCSETSNPEVFAACSPYLEGYR